MLQLRNITVSTDLFRGMAELWRNDKFLDCRLVCQDGELGCSQLVVAAQSPLLRLLLAGLGEEGEIFLPDFSLAAAQQVVATLHGLPPTRVAGKEEQELAAMLGLPALPSLARAAIQEAGQPGPTPATPPASPVRRSRRAKAGQHWKYEASEATPQKQEGGAAERVESDRESVKSDLTNTLEAFDDEIDEFEVKSVKEEGRRSKRKSEIQQKRSSKKIRKAESLQEKAVKSPREADVRLCRELGAGAGWACDQCQQVCRSLTAVKAHLAYSHGLQLPFPCQQCGDTFLTGGQLRAHSGRAHTTSAPTAIDKGGMIGMYHLKKYYTFLPKEEALKILPSYYDVRKESNVLCRVCEDEFENEEIVRTHLLEMHLKLMLFKCELCGQKLKTECNYQEHIGSEHGASSIQTLELPNEIESASNVVIVNQDEDSSSADQNLTTIVINESEAQPPARPREAEGRGRVKRSGGKRTEKIYVEGAERPILGKTRTKLDKLTNGRLFSAEEAEETVKQNLTRRVVGQDRQYACLVCSPGPGWSHAKLEVARDHVYDHFGIYLYQCGRCLDLFRKQAHYHRHLEIHTRREEAAELAGKDKVGGLHLLSLNTYLHWKQAKPVIDTYWLRDGRTGCCCKLCAFACQNPPHMRAHLLQQHLKLWVFKCPDCGEHFSLEPDIKKHMWDKHKVEFESLDKVDDPEYESTETEVDVTPEEIVNLPFASLFGKKISTAQGKILRKTKITKNEAEGVYECELCEFKKEYQAQLSDHVMTSHYNVFLYRCAVPNCAKLLRNWSRLTTHRLTHRDKPEDKPVLRPKRQPFRTGSSALREEAQYHLLQEDVFVGKEDGLKIAREYFFYQEEQGAYKCKLCEYSGRHQTVEQHVLALHLRKLFLYKCETCGKMIRYSENAFKDHLLLHSVGKLPCTLCQQLDQGGEKRFTKASLAAHVRRIHKDGEYRCTTDSCESEFRTVAELRQHERQQHQLGLPAARQQLVCELCQHVFPRRQQLEGHQASCRAGRSRSRFRKMISDCLTWQGGGVYRCNFCQETFQPPRPTASSLPLARKHVVTVHKMSHLRKAKMTWTQGVNGLNVKKKAARMETMESVRLGIEEQQLLEGVPEQEVVLQYVDYESNDVANTEEVVESVALDGELAIEEKPNIHVINTFYEV